MAPIGLLRLKVCTGNLLNQAMRALCGGDMAPIAHLGFQSLCLQTQRNNMLNRICLIAASRDAVHCCAQTSSEKSIASIRDGMGRRRHSDHPPGDVGLYTLRPAAVAA